MSSMKPCMNPMVCGVQNHRAETVCGATLAKSTASVGNMTAVPPSPNMSVDQRQNLEEFEGFSEPILMETFDDGQVYRYDSPDGEKILAFTAKSHNSEFSTMYIGREITLGYSEYDDEEYDDDRIAAFMGSELGEADASRYVSTHNNNVVIDNAGWVIPGTPHAGVSTLTQFAENSAAHANDGSYDWESMDLKDYPEGHLERENQLGEVFTKTRYEPAFVLRDYAETPEGRQELLSMNLPEANLRGHEPIHTNPYGR